MTITVAKSAGFCAGVARAVGRAYKELEANPKAKLATLGQLIHNRTVTDDLAAKGIRIINSLEEVGDETLIIRSHGIPKAIEEELQARQIPYIDCTCPWVKAVHRKAMEAAATGRKLIVLGEPTHPEVVGTVSYGGEGVIIAKDETSLLPPLNPKEKYTLVAQTTFDTASFIQITTAIDHPNIEIYNTICNATYKRQQEAAKLAKTTDTMIILGDPSSANSQALYNISRNICPKTIFIGSIHDLQLQDIKASDKIGVTAGASTPPALTKEAVQLMSEFANTMPEETQDKTQDKAPDQMMDETMPEAQEPQGQSDEAAFIKMLEESFKKPLHSGRTVKGKVIKVTPTEVTVDLGYKSDGIITRQEFTDDPNADITQLTQVGDVFDVFIIRVNDGDGNVLASKKKLDNAKNIHMLEEALANKTVVTGKITEVIKGGLLANIHGCRVFIPSSQVSNRFVDDLTQFKGKEMNLHMLEIDRGKRRYVAGRKELAAQEARQVREEMYAKLEVGQRLEGTVSRLVDFGAFVDIGGIDGLIHVSEMAWKRVRKVTDVLQVGDNVTVTVIAVDKDKNKISLSLKDITNDPWNGIAEKYPIGSIVEGQVVRLAAFGAFVSLEDGIDGLVHISQIANRHIAKADEVLKVGEMVQVMVTNVDQEAHRINLSKREADIELGYEVPDDVGYYEGEDDGYDLEPEYDEAMDDEMPEGSELEAEAYDEAEEVEAAPEAEADEAAAEEPTPNSDEEPASEEPATDTPPTE